MHRIFKRLELRDQLLLETEKCNDDGVSVESTKGKDLFLNISSIGNRDKQDEMVWVLEEEEGFSIKSMCEALGSPSHLSFPRECVWDSHVQSKFSFLLWEVWWNRIPMIDNLRRRGIILPNWCCLCKGDEESVDHIFLHCP